MSSDSEFIFISENSFTNEHVTRECERFNVGNLLQFGYFEVWPVPELFTDIGDYTEDFRNYDHKPLSTAQKSANGRKFNRPSKTHKWRTRFFNV